MAGVGNTTVDDRSGIENSAGETQITQRRSPRNSSTDDSSDLRDATITLLPPSTSSEFDRQVQYRKNRRMVSILLKVGVKLLALGLLAFLVSFWLHHLEVRMPHTKRHRWQPETRNEENVQLAESRSTNEPGQHASFGSELQEGSLVVDTSGTKGLMWFAHVTDLHISKFQDPTRYKEFQILCEHVLPTFRPAVVLVTGDLTDAKTLDYFGSDQVEWEWQTYRQIIDASNITGRTTWLDMRGNHDDFNVPSLSHANNFYNRYAVSGRTDKRYYRHRQEYEGYGTKHSAVSFIGIDAAPDPGPKRPFNFFGLLDAGSVAAVMYEADKAEADSNVTLFFGHYPSSVITAAAPGFLKMTESGLAYFCGHLHTLGGLVPSMWTIQPTGMLELELGDWKDNRMIRLAALDNEMLTFIDMRFNAEQFWPVVLVTMPKRKNIMSLSHEPLEKMLYSSHIRVLVFSADPIETVELQLPGQQEWFRMEQAATDSPVYVLRWHATAYAKGTHTFHVRATDHLGRTRDLLHTFQLDTTSLITEFAFFARFLLMTNFYTVLMWFICIMMTLMVVPLFAYRETRNGRLLRRTLRPLLHCGRDLPHSMQFALRAMANNSWICYSLLTASVYTLVGPWYVGEIMTGTYGIAFAWGVLCSFGRLSSELTIGYTAVHLFLYVVPFQWAIFCYLTIKRACRGKSRLLFYAATFPVHAVFLFTLAFNAFGARAFLLYYGWISLATGALKVGTGILLQLYVWWRLQFYAVVNENYVDRSSASVSGSNNNRRVDNGNFRMETYRESGRTD